jgi:hypothetical protein
MKKIKDPKYIVTKQGDIFTFKAWYTFSISDVPNSSWFGAQVADKNGNNFGVPFSNIQTKIYTKNET